MAINGKTVYPVYRANRDVRRAVMMGGVQSQ